MRSLAQSVSFVDFFFSYTRYLPLSCGVGGYRTSIMSLSKYESEVKRLALPQAAAYARFSDLRNLQAVKERLDDPASRAALTQRLPADKVDEVEKSLREMTFDADSLSLVTPVGAVRLVIVERTPETCIKFTAEGSPIPLTLWIQLLPADEASAHMRVTVGAEVNMFMKAMVAGPLKKAAEGIAQVLTAAASN